MKKIAVILILTVDIISCKDFHNFHLVKADSLTYQSTNKTDTLQTEIKDSKKILKYIFKYN